MAGCALRAVSDQFPPEFKEIIDLLTVLCAYNDRRWVEQDLTALLQHRVQTVQRQFEAEHPDERGA